MKNDTIRLAGARPMIEWTRPMLERFKIAYQATNAPSFMFDGHEFFGQYAKYLIEYLEGKLSK